MTPGIITYPVMSVSKSFVIRIKPNRWPSKTLLTIYERGSKMVRNSVYDCHLSPVGRKIAIEISVTNYFDLRSSIE